MLLPSHRLQPGLFFLIIKGWIVVCGTRGDSDPGIEGIRRNLESDGAAFFAGEDFTDTGLPLVGSGLVAFAGTDQFSGEGAVAVCLDLKADFTGLVVP